MLTIARAHTSTPAHPPKNFVASPAAGAALNPLKSSRVSALYNVLFYALWSLAAMEGGEGGVMAQGRRHTRSNDFEKYDCRRTYVCVCVCSHPK